MGFLTWRVCRRHFIPFLMMMMMMCFFMCNSDVIVRAPQNYVNNNTLSLIGYTNGSLEIDCDVNASHSFTWTKDGVELELGQRIVTSHEGKLIFTTLHRNDSGQYSCTAGINRTRGRNITLRVIGSFISEKLRMATLVGISSAPTPVGAFTLPEWMISAACVIVIALVTIIIIVTYVRMSKPKKGDTSNHSNVEMSAVTEESIEVVSVKKGSSEEVRETPNQGHVRQRKSSSSPTHDSCNIENECLQEKSASKKKREGKEKEKERKGILCTVEYVKEIPEKLGLSEGSKKEKIEKLKSESARTSKKGFAVPGGCMPEKFTRMGDRGCDEKMSSKEYEKKLAGSGNAKELKREHFSMKHQPKTPIDSNPGQSLRKIISDPCLMNRPPFLAAHTIVDNTGKNSDPTQGQTLRRISSEPIRQPTIYNGPVIKGSLKLDKKSLKELKSKIQKSTKSPAEIQRYKDVSRKKDNRSKKFIPAAISFTNEIYGSVEELRAPEDIKKATTVYEESETEPIYEEIQVDREGKGKDEKCDRKKADGKEVNYSLQNTRGKGSTRKCNNEKSGSKHEYEPRKLDFGQDLPESMARLQKLSSPKVEESYEKHEKCIENLSFSILEDLEEFDDDFDQEPNVVADGIYQDIEGQPSQIAEALDQTTESLYEEIHLSSCIATCQDEYEEVNELA